MPANDPRYQGIYNDRELALDELKEMNAIIRESPWAADRMEKVYEKLYDGCREHAEDHAALSEELELLQRKLVEKPSSKLKKQIEDLKNEIATKWDWYKSFDRRVYLLHVQLAAGEPAVKNDLVERYRFHAEVQRLARSARTAFTKANDYDNFFKSLSPKEITDDLEDEYFDVLTASWKALKKIAKDAREINLPAMKYFTDGSTLEDHILEGKLTPEPPESLKDSLVSKLMNQLQGVRNRSARLNFKSLNGILDVQEKLIAKWRAGTPSQPAAVEDAVEAEILEAEVLEAEVLDAEVLEAEVLPVDDAAESLDAVPAEILPAEVIPDVPPAATVPPVAAAPAQQVAQSPVVTIPTATAAPAKPAALAPPAEELPASPVAQIFALDAAASPPVSANELFSLDVDQPAAATLPGPASVPVDGLDALMSLDADVQQPTAPAAVTKAQPAPVNGPVEELFSLDADDAPAPASAPSPPPREASFSLDADDAERQKPVATAQPPAAPTATAAGTVPQPTTPTKSPTALSVVSLPALNTSAPGASRNKRKRPPVKITFVKPGQKSPFAK